MAVHDCPSSDVPLLTPTPYTICLLTLLSPCTTVSLPITLLTASISNCSLANEFVLAPIGKASYESVRSVHIGCSCIIMFSGRIIFSGSLNQVDGAG